MHGNIIKKLLVYSYLYPNLQKSHFIFYLLSFSSTKLENRKSDQVLLWEGGVGTSKEDEIVGKKVGG
jgi:hypothetical protein